MSKIYIVDTNIIVSNPYFLNQFRDATIIIPSVVLQEVDNFKRDNELSRNVRIFSNILDKLYENNYKIKETNVDVKIIFRDYDLDIVNLLGGYNNDNLIIEIADYFNKNNSDVTLLSNDILVRIKARGLGINATSFTSELSVDNSDIIYPGYRTWNTYGRYIDLIYSEGFLMISDESKEMKEKILPHMFFIIKEIEGSKSAIAKVNADKTKLELVNPNIKPVSGILPKNSEQRMALQLLLDPDIHLIALTGCAGTGKTLLTLASALVLKEEKLYDKITIAKPTIDSSKEIGFLPGGMEEKLFPYLQSYYDNLEFLMGENYDLQMLNINIVGLNYLRGRTLPNQIIIIDEVQNLTKKEIKTIVTRAGDNTKIILLGDLKQIDNKSLDEVNNGLSYIINKFKGQDIFGTVNLTKGVRSKLATIASEIL